jgi:plasmid replication initiation protein
MKKLESDDSLVVRANQLIEAKYRLTATEQKIIYMLTAMVNKDDEDFKPYNLMITDLISLIYTDSHSKYAEVKAVSRNMMKKVFTIHDTVKDEEIQVAWFSSVNYKHKKGIVEFEFSPYLKPLMLQLKSHFTKFKLSNVMQLRSCYSLRLYELLKQYEKISKREFSIVQLRQLIDISKTEYPRYPNFKQKVLTPAYNEINARTDIIFDFEEVKEGKKVVALIFNIHPKRKSITAEPPKQPNNTTPTNQTEVEAIKAEFKRLYGGELVDKFVTQMLSEKGLEHVQECLRTYKDYIQGQKIRNLGGHFREFVMSGYQKPTPHNGKDTITAPKYEAFRATDEERREVEESYKQIAESSFKSMREFLGGRIKIPET